jgi:hypothetical protein
MPWQMTFDITVTPRVGGGIGGLIGAIMAVAVGVVLYGVIWYSRGGGLREIVRNLAAVFALLVGAGIGVLAMFATQRTTTRLQNDLIAGRFSEIVGTIAKAQAFGTHRGATTVVFSVGTHRFMFPFHAPESCLPANGEAARIDYVRNAGPGLYGITDTIVRMYMQRGCPFEVFR